MERFDDMPERWLTVADLATILGLKRQTIYNRLCCCPESLPPATRAPGFRGPRWSSRIVRQWQARYDPPDLVEALLPGSRPAQPEIVTRRARTVASSDE